MVVSNKKIKIPTEIKHINRQPLATVKIPKQILCKPSGRFEYNQDYLFTIKCVCGVTIKHTRRPAR